MNTPQQVDAVKAIIRIKNKILQTSDWDEIAELIQRAIDVSLPVQANNEVDSLDRTKSKEWNIMSVKMVMKSVKERNFTNIETVYPEVTTALLRLSMTFVKGGLEEVNKILAASLLNKGIFSTGKKNLQHR